MLQPHRSRAQSQTKEEPDGAETSQNRFHEVCAKQRICIGSPSGVSVPVYSYFTHSSNKLGQLASKPCPADGKTGSHSVEDRNQRAKSVEAME